jgi:hypothetical protein
MPVLLAPFLHHPLLFRWRGRAQRLEALLAQMNSQQAVHSSEVARREQEHR